MCLSLSYGGVFMLEDNYGWNATAKAWEKSTLAVYGLVEMVGGEQFSVGFDQSSMPRDGARGERQDSGRTSIVGRIDSRH